MSNSDQKVELTSWQWLMLMIILSFLVGGQCNMNDKLRRIAVAVEKGQSR